MTKKTIKCGPHSCKAYKKPAGKGHEVGLSIGRHDIFVGNFVRPAEATAWWKLMNAELSKFARRYSHTQIPAALFTRFLSNYVYKCYYSYLDREFSKYNRGYSQAVRKDVRKISSYQRMTPPPTHSRTPQRRAA